MSTAILGFGCSFSIGVLGIQRSPIWDSSFARRTLGMQLLGIVSDARDCKDRYYMKSGRKDLAQKGGGPAQWDWGAWQKYAEDNKIHAKRDAQNKQWKQKNRGDFAG